MVLLEFSMTPSTKEESKSPYVARILDVIDRSGLSYQLTPMVTIIEGDWAEVTLTNFAGTVVGGDLVLKGLCSECCGDVASLIEMG